MASQQAFKDISGRVDRRTNSEVYFPKDGWNSQS